MTSQKQIEANRRNAKKAGRKKGPATIAREKVKDYIAEQIALHIAPIVKRLIKASVKGDVFATKELFDRGFGKATQTSNITVRDVIPFDDVEDNGLSKDKKVVQKD